jgi:hypothetical protein
MNARQTYFTDYRQRRKDGGVCCRCGGSALTGKTVCQRCLDTLKRLAKESYDFYRELSICPLCKKRKVRPYHAVCPICLLRQRWRRGRPK